VGKVLFSVQGQFSINSPRPSLNTDVLYIPTILQSSFSMSVLGQKRDKSQSGNLIGNFISAAIMAKVAYQPSIAAMKANTPPI
jgi:hypothetical protein